MQELLKKYEESTSPSVESARKQSEGDQSTAVNFFDIEQTYQNNFTTRDKGNKTVTLSNDGNHTEGNFKVDALKHYNKEIEDLDNLKYHKYNRSKADEHYINLNDTELGIVYQPAYSSSPAVTSSPTTPTIPTNPSKENGIE